MNDNECFVVSILIFLYARNTQEPFPSVYHQIFSWYLKIMWSMYSIEQYQIFPKSKNKMTTQIIIWMSLQWNTIKIILFSN